MDSQKILDILVSKRTKQEIIEAFEILCSPMHSLNDCARAYRRHEFKKRNRQSYISIIKQRPH